MKEAAAKIGGIECRTHNWFKDLTTGVMPGHVDYTVGQEVASTLHGSTKVLCHALRISMEETKYGKLLTENS